MILHQINDLFFLFEYIIYNVSQLLNLLVNNLNTGSVLLFQNVSEILVRPFTVDVTANLNLKPYFYSYVSL